MVDLVSFLIKIRLLINYMLRDRYREDVANRRWQDQLLAQPDENNEIEGKFYKLFIKLY